MSQLSQLTAGLMKSWPPHSAKEDTRIALLKLKGEFKKSQNSSELTYLSVKASPFFWLTLYFTKSESLIKLKRGLFWIDLWTNKHGTKTDFPGSASLLFPLWFIFVTFLNEASLASHNLWNWMKLWHVHPFICKARIIPSKLKYI